MESTSLGTKRTANFTRVRLVVDDENEAVDQAQEVECMGKHCSLCCLQQMIGISFLGFLILVVVILLILELWRKLAS